MRWHCAVCLLSYPRRFSFSRGIFQYGPCVTPCTPQVCMVFFECVYVVCICVGVGATGKSVLVLMYHLVWDSISVVTSPWLYRHWGDRHGLPHLTLRCLGILTKVLTFAAHPPPTEPPPESLPIASTGEGDTAHSFRILGLPLPQADPFAHWNCEPHVLPATRSHSTLGRRSVVAYPRTMASQELHHWTVLCLEVWGQGGFGSTWRQKNKHYV